MYQGSFVWCPQILLNKKNKRYIWSFDIHQRANLVKNINIGLLDWLNLSVQLPITKILYFIDKNLYYFFHRFFNVHVMVTKLTGSMYQTLKSLMLRKKLFLHDCCGSLELIGIQKLTFCFRPVCYPRINSNV